MKFISNIQQTIVRYFLSALPYPTCVEVDDGVLAVVDVLRGGARGQLVVRPAVHVDPDVLIAQFQILREDTRPRLHGERSG